ncbi:hypothetical protein ACVWW6_008809 [Bradyrhizobium sp. USDA 3311]
MRTLAFLNSGCAGRLSASAAGQRASLLRYYTEGPCRISLIYELHALGMNPKSKLYQPDHWRGRAEATRKKAEALADGKPRDRLLKIAMEYDKLALRAQVWQTRSGEDDVA